MNRPTVAQLVRAVRIAIAATGAASATYRFEGRIAVALPAGWELCISPEDAGRFRLDACLSGRVRATMWCLAGDDARLAELAAAAGREATALAVA